MVSLGGSCGGQGGKGQALIHAPTPIPFSETERRAAQEVFASEGRRVMSRCRLAAEDDDLFELVFPRATVNFGLRFSAPAPTRPGGAAAGTPRGTKTEAAKCDAIVLQKKNIPFPVRGRCSSHAHHTLTSAQGRAARSV